MEKPVRIDTLKEKELVTGITAKMIHTDQLTIAHVNIKKNAILPEHAHFNEQVTHLIEGVLALTVNGTEHILKSGMSMVIPSNVRHSAKAVTPCEVIDTFCPVREDYK